MPAKRLSGACKKVCVVGLKRKKDGTEGRRNSEGFRRRMYQFAGLLGRPSEWLERVVLFCDHNRSSVKVDRAPTVTKLARLMGVDRDGTVRFVSPRGHEFLMGLPSGFVGGCGLTETQEKQSCGDGVVPHITEAIAEWLERLLAED